MLSCSPSTLLLQYLREHAGHGDQSSYPFFKQWDGSVMKMKKDLSVFCMALFLLGNATAQVQSIKNGVLWRDTDGQRIRANGISVIEHDGTFYMVGADNSVGYASPVVNLYSSTDLMNWEFRNTIIDKNTNAQLASGERFIERPCLIYNAKNNLFVVWVKYQGKGYTADEAAVFYSNTVDEKYTFHKAFQPLGFDSNDCSLFEESDGTAYFISTNKANGSLNLYTLSDDYLDVIDYTILFSGQNKEAPVILKKDNMYYLLASAKTGWNPNQGTYSTSRSLKSGWSAWKNFGDKFTFATQPTTVIPITTSAGTSYYYVGDRWKDPMIEASKTLILPLIVGDGTVSLTNVHEFTVDFDTGDFVEYDDNSYVPQDNWTLVSVSNEHPSYPAVNSFDGNSNSFWHTNWVGGAQPHPHEIVINLGATYSVSGFMYVPRMDNNPNGNVEYFQLFLSGDGSNWGLPVAAGRLNYQSEVHFETATAHYMKFVSHSEIQGQKHSAASDFRLLTNSDYKKTEIVSWYQINGGTWINDTVIKIDPGADLMIGPQPRLYGSHSWTGPNGFYADTRPLTFNNVDASVDGEYTVYCLDDQYYCHKKTIVIQVNAPLSIGNHPGTISSPFNVYPNPAKDYFTISLNGIENPALSMYDMKGNLVYENYTNESLIRLSTYPNFGRGVYIVKIEGDNQRLYHQKLIVQ